MRFHADETDFKTAPPLDEDAQQIVICSSRRQEALISPCSVNDLPTPRIPEKTSPRISRMTRINANFSHRTSSSRREGVLPKPRGATLQSRSNVLISKCGRKGRYFPLVQGFRFCVPMFGQHARQEALASLASAFKAPSARHICRSPDNENIPSSVGAIYQMIALKPELRRLNQNLSSP
jgi:hypothetical protein